MIEISLNILVILSLVVCIAGGMILDKRLRQFNRQRQELNGLINRLETTMKYAEHHLQQVEHLMVEADTMLQPKITQAIKLQDELEYIISRADASAQQLFTNLNQPAEAMMSTGTEGPSWAGDLRHSLKNLR